MTIDKLKSHLIKIGFIKTSFDTRNGWGVGAIGESFKHREMEVRIGTAYCAQQSANTNYITVSYKDVKLVDEEQNEWKWVCSGTEKMSNYYVSHSNDEFEKAINF